MFKNSNEEQPRPTIDTGPGLTKKAMKNETDINFIMRKYKKTGIINFVNENKGDFMEVPEIDFQQAMETIKHGENLFSKMPSDLRKEFKNDPGVFLQFVHDPKNTDRMIELGLAERPPGENPTQQPPEATGTETPPPASSEATES